jgi:hypothetical protein
MTNGPNGPFQFVNRAPGNYELYAETQGDRRGLVLGAYVPLSLERDMTRMTVTLLPMSNVRFDIQSTQGGRLMDTSRIKLQARRVDLAGEGEVEDLPNSALAQLLQGRWQMMLVPSAEYVAADFRGPRGERPEGNHFEGWNEITVNSSYCSVRIVVSSKPGGVHGTVTSGANEPAAGVPVFLEAYDEVARKRMVELRITRTDVKGHYNFVGLAPGTYRLVSTFEYQAPTTADIDAMSPRVFLVEEGRDQQQDLDSWVMR